MTGNRILAIDPGTKMGWAYWDGEQVTSGTEDFSEEVGVSWAAAWWRLRHWLDDMTEEMGPGIIAFEDQWRIRGKWAPLCWGWQHEILTFCHLRQHDIRPLVVNAATLKRWATGDGNATKAAMMWAARARGYDPQTDDEADALLIRAWAQERLSTDDADDTDEGERR